MENEQLTVLAWVIGGALLATVAAVIALWRSGRDVPFPAGDRRARPR